MEKNEIIETEPTPEPTPEAPQPKENSEGLVVKEYENREGDPETAEIPIEEANSTREFQMKLLGHNNNSGMYYRNSGMNQYTGERKFSLNTYSTATYSNPSNVSLFREAPISTDEGSSDIPIPQGYELRDIDINRPINSSEIISEENNNESEITN